MAGLFDLIEEEDRGSTLIDWRPEPPPSLDGIDEIIIDLETTGLKWWERDRPGGAAYYLPDGRSGYLAWGHKNCGNQHDEAVIKRWFQREVRNKRITNAHTKFDNHMLYSWGVDLEEQGCVLSDVQHYAALLDDHRRVFNQASLCNDYLTDEHKVTVVEGRVLNPSRMMEYSPGVVAVRAIGDVRQVYKLKQVMWPMLDDQDLQRVRQLEDECTFATCEMERNGALIDVEKLNRWVIEVQRAFEQIIWAIYRETGIRFNPDSNEAWLKLFQRLKLPITAYTAGGRPSFTGAVLRRIEHPLVKQGLHAGKLADLLSKYLIKYQKTVGSDGILRFALHQLRGDDGGTISGRYSSSALKINDEIIGTNIQQVLAVEKQIESYGNEFIVKELFIAEEGEVINADAEQVEYRIFADYAATPKVLQAYKENPRLKFHHYIWDLIKPYKPDLLYKPLKNLNFAKIYGAKIVKIALMMEYISEEDAKDLNGIASSDYRRMLGDPRLRQAHEVLNIYARELPEVEPLLKMASSLAEKRGYVKTMLGRRMRFPYKDRLHKALNGVIQGTAGDIMKKILVEVRKARKTLNFKMRATVHDSLFGDSRDKETTQKLTTVLNTQVFPQMKVPILWKVTTGPTWKDCE